LPLSKLAELRQIFFPVLGLTTNERAFVLTQVLLPGYREYRENQLVGKAGVVVSTGARRGEQTTASPRGPASGRPPHAGPARLAEYADRLDAALAWIDLTYLLARLTGARGVVLDDAGGNVQRIASERLRPDLIGTEPR